MQEITEIINRLARLLVLRQMDLLNAERPVDRKTCLARLEGAADATFRVVNAYGPEQVLSAVRETVNERKTPVAGGHREWFENRVSILADKLALILRDEAGH